MSYRPDNEQRSDSGPVRYMACSFCGRQALVEILMHHGARCSECFRAYVGEVGCAESVSRGRLRDSLRRLAAKMRDGTRDSREWAYALRERHRNGEILGKAQIDAYQAVVHES